GVELDAVAVAHHLAGDGQTRARAQRVVALVADDKLHVAAERARVERDQECLAGDAVDFEAEHRGRHRGVEQRLLRALQELGIGLALDQHRADQPRASEVTIERAEHLVEARLVGVERALDGDEVGSGHWTVLSSMRAQSSTICGCSSKAPMRPFMTSPNSTAPSALVKPWTSI